MKPPHRTIKDILEHSSSRTADPEPGSVLAEKPELAQERHAAYQQQRAKLEKLLGPKAVKPLTRWQTVEIMDVLERIYTENLDADSASIECERILDSHTN